MVNRYMKDRDGHTPFQNALICNNPDSAESFKPNSIKRIIKQTRKVIHILARKANLKTLEWLYHECCSTDENDYDEDYKINLDFVELLNLKSVCSRNETPLVAVYKCGDLDQERLPVMGWLINHGADLSVADSIGRTLLHLCTEGNDAQTLIFLKNNIDYQQISHIVNIADNEKQTALHYAYSYNEECKHLGFDDSSIDSILVMLGANPNCRSKHKDTLIPFGYYLENYCYAYRERMTVGRFDTLLNVLLLNWNAGLDLKQLLSLNKFYPYIKWLGDELTNIKYITKQVYDESLSSFVCKKNSDIFEKHRSILKLFHQANLFCSYTSSKTGNLCIKLCQTAIPIPADVSKDGLKFQVLQELVEFGNMPAKLQDIAADVVRKCLQPNCIVGLNDLNIPSMLSSVIMQVPAY